MPIKKYTIHPKYGSPLIDHPVEDSCLTSDKHPIAVVADGITILDRNPDGTYPVFPDGQSGPKKVADLFCQKTILWLDKQYPSIKLETIRQAFQKGNEEVKELNQKLLNIKPDESNYGADSFAAVAAITCLVNNQLIYGFLTDCGVAIVGKDAQLKFITPEIWPRIEQPTDKHLQNILKKGQGSYRQYRNYVRNNPELVVGEQFYSHGVINGQEGMLKYVEVGQQELSQGDTVVVFTDGFRHYFQHQEFLKILSKDDLNEFEKELDFLGFDLLQQGKAVPEYGFERTLVLLRR
jgi:hypothetical protein